MHKKEKSEQIMVVGQTPPPYGGQAIMIQRMLSARWDRVQLHHVRMNFMTSMDQRGKASIRKIAHLFLVIFQIYITRFRTGSTTLYYPPCNTPKSAIYRDLAIIGCTRFLFKRLIYHFHAAGISESIPKLHPIERWLALKILMKPDMTITSSPYNPEDGVFLKCKNNKIIPLGIPDEIPCRQQTIALQSGTLEILFLGLLNGTKGEGYLVEAISILNLKGLRVHVRIAGTFESQEYRTLFFNKVNDLGISNQVSYLGVVTGQAKLNAFAASDLLCFPSFFESESFGVVLLEAMQAGIPIVASRWRGIQSAIEDGENGYLVNPKDAEDLAEKIERFFSNPKLIYELGLNGRKLYENKYRLEHHIKALNNAFLDH